MRVKSTFNITPENVEAFGNEIKQIYFREKASLGRDDLDNAEFTDNTSKFLEFLGRTMISSGNPIQWGIGVMFLNFHYTIEFSQGHNIFHSQYESIPGNHKFKSDSWVWKNTVDEEDWKFEDQLVHHPFTNTVGKDNDLGYLFFRANSVQNWEPHHLFQLPLVLTQPIVSSIFFPIYVAMSRAMTERKNIFDIENYRRAFKKIGLHASTNYLLFPILGGPMAGSIFWGNFIANILSNYHLQFILGVSHLTGESEVFPERWQETEGEFFVRQVSSTINYEIPRYLEVLYGGINNHIEHHLFPDLPPNRLKKIAPEIREICEKYGIAYKTGPFLLQIGKLLENLFVQSFPIPNNSLKRTINTLVDPAAFLSNLSDGFMSYLKILSGNKDPLRKEIRVLQKILDASDSAAILKLEIPEELILREWEAGSYISLEFNINGEKFIRQYSLTRPYSKNPVYEICVKRVKGGTVSNFIIDELKPDEKITLLGKPGGDFVLRHLPEKTLFIAAGSGITPVIAMVRKISREAPGHDMNILVFQKSESLELFGDVLEDISLNEGFKVFQVYTKVDPDIKKTYPPTHGKSIRFFSYLDKEVIMNRIPDWKERHIYLCGPEEFMNTTISILKEHEYNFANFHMESFLPVSVDESLIDSEKKYAIKFSKSGRIVHIKGKTSLLSALRGAGIILPTGCLRGKCRVCQVNKISGRIIGEDESGPEKKVITTCCSYPASDIHLDI